MERPAKALISLRVCAGWSEPLLVAHTTLLELSCHDSFYLSLDFGIVIELVHGTLRKITYAVVRTEAKLRLPPTVLPTMMAVPTFTPSELLS